MSASRPYSYPGALGVGWGERAGWRRSDHPYLAHQVGMAVPSDPGTLAVG